MRFPKIIPTVFALLKLANASTQQCTSAKNNLQRCFVSSSVLASSYCSSFLSIPTVTVTATAYTTTPVPTIVSTVLDVLTESTTSTTFSTLTSTTVQTTFTTTTVTDAALIPKRATSTFNCVVSSTPVLYASSSISFACACLALPTPTTTVTATTSTRINYESRTTTSSSTTLDEIVTTLPQTVTQTDTETDVVTSTTYTSSSSTPACTPGGNVPLNDGGGVFEPIFVGSGVSENPNNPSNQATPDVTTFPGSIDGCAAAQACAEFVYNSANNDFSFDLHYLIAENVWSCTGYFNGLSTAADWNVLNSDIGASYGYTLYG